MKKKDNKKISMPKVPTVTHIIERDGKHIIQYSKGVRVIEINRRDAYGVKEIVSIYGPK